MIAKMTNFKYARERSGLTQTQIAKLVGVAQACVNRLEREGCYNVKTAVKYAKHMNTTPLRLLDGLDI